MANGTLVASQLEMLTLSGTGVITIVPPNTNTNRTLTLPDATGTVQVSGTGISGTTGTFSGDMSFNSGYGSAAVAYGCRAWVNFNGAGTVAIRASGNVSSITDNGTGDYTVNFTTAMPDGDYSVAGVAQIDLGTTLTAGKLTTIATPTASGSRLKCTNAGTGAATDMESVQMSVFR